MATHALNELTSTLKLSNIPLSEIRCASIEYQGTTVQLKAVHTKEELSSFLHSLDFNYDSGYGDQNLYGHVWLNNGDWLERTEYDGSEHWTHTGVPQIPYELL